MSSKPIQNFFVKKHVQIGRYYQDSFVSNEDVVLKQLLHEGIDIDKLSEEELVRFDQFDHVGEIKNTQMLASMVSFVSGMLILDAGGGMGGAARYLAHTCGCRVHVIDLIPKRCAGGLKLTRRTGLDHMVTFQAADALYIPFRDKVFDLVWSQDAFDGIEDKDLLLRECRRILKPDGELIFTDHLRGPVEAVPDGIYLLPEDKHQSTFEGYRMLLEKCGFKLLEEIDLTDWALDSMRRVSKGIRSEQGFQIEKAQGAGYIRKLFAFVDSFTGYLESGAIQYGAFRASRNSL
jgi:ubiquinone/menaquinone biosynthesis C-methylase UbiE